MSLINDALKRAKQAQEQEPTTVKPSLQLRPVVANSRPASRSGVSFVLPIALAVAALLAVFFVRKILQSHTSDLRVEARTPTAVVRDTHSVPVLPAMTVSKQPVKAASILSATNVPLTVASATREASAATTPGAAEGTAGNPAVAVTVAAAPRPAPLRLQAIIYRPKHPSAVIGGRTLFVGDKVGELRVVAIDQTSATLVGGGRTNVLELPE